MNPSMPEQTDIQNSSGTAAKPLIFSLLLAAGLLAGMNINREKKDKFSQIFDIIGKDYVDSTRLHVLEKNTIDFLLDQLDPHSTYIPPSLTEINERQIRGSYQGVGIEYIRFMDTVFVFSVYPGGPAEKAGVKPGDRLLEAAGKSLTDTLDNTELQEAIQGSGTAQLTLRVYRRSDHKIHTLALSKSNIVMNSTEVYYMVSKTLGYMKLDRFSGNTYKEFMAALNALKARGMKDLILDLRNNGGGLLNEAVAIANEFLQKDEIISYTYGFHRSKNFYRADGNGTFKEGRLLLLINHNSASASEILAAAMQDNDRAVVMGNRSFGKGLVQEPFRLSDGSIIRLTIARYYTPSGRSIQKTYTAGKMDLYRNEIYRRDWLKDTLNPVFDSTVQKKYFSKNGRLLTSGGGIRPDVFLRDTLSDSTEIEMLMPGLFYSRIFDIYVLDHFKQLTNVNKNVLSDVYLFQDYYTVDQADALRFIALAQHIPYLRKLKYSKNTAEIIKRQLKAALAYRLFGETGYSQLVNLEDGIFSKSFGVLQNYRQILNIGRRNTRRFDY